MMDKFANFTKLIGDVDDLFSADISDRSERGRRGRVMILELGNRKRDRKRSKMIHMRV